MALIFAASVTGRWSSHKITFRSVSKLGPVTEIGSEVSLLKTDNEHVASKPIPRTVEGLMFCSVRARWTAVQMQVHMSVVDCSWVEWISYGSLFEVCLCMCMGKIVRRIHGRVARDRYSRRLGRRCRLLRR